MTLALSPMPAVGRAVALLVTVGPGTEVPGVPVVVTWMKAGLGVPGLAVGPVGLAAGVVAVLVCSAGLGAPRVAAATVC